MFQLTEIQVMLLRIRRIGLLAPIQFRNLFQLFFAIVLRYHIFPFPKNVPRRTRRMFHAQWQHLNVDVENGIFGLTIGGRSFLVKDGLLVGVAQCILFTAHLHQLVAHFQVAVLVPMCSFFGKRSLFFFGELV